MTDLFDCSPQIAAKLARCQRMAMPRPYPYSLAPLTDDDAYILNRLDDDFYTVALSTGISTAKAWDAVASWRRHLNS